MLTQPGRGSRVVSRPVTIRAMPPEILDALRARLERWPEADRLSTSGTFDVTAKAALDVVARS